MHQLRSAGELIELLTCTLTGLFTRKPSVLIQKESETTVKGVSFHHPTTTVLCFQHNIVLVPNGCHPLNPPCTLQQAPGDYDCACLANQDMILVSNVGVQTRINYTTGYPVTVEAVCNPETLMYDIHPPTPPPPQQTNIEFVICVPEGAGKPRKVLSFQ